MDFEALRWASVAGAVLVQAGGFLPTTLLDWLAVTGIICAAVLSTAGAAWRWLFVPLHKDVEEIKQRQFDLATFEHNTGGRMSIVQGDINRLKEDLNRLDKGQRAIATDAKEEAALRNKQHAEIMNMLGQIQGQLRR